MPLAPPQKAKAAAPPAGRAPGAAPVAPAAARPSPKPAPKPAQATAQATPGATPQAPAPQPATTQPRAAASAAPQAPLPAQGVAPPVASPRPATAAAVPVQAKTALPTSQPGDSAERDADARATQVMRGGAGPHAAAATTSPATATGTATASGPLLSAEDQARLGAGEPLAPDLRATLEQRFGTPLGQVRVMNDSAAAGAANAIQARAFTLGHRIGFAAGEYQPGTPAGQWLLAHEIAHVLQQQDGSVPRVVMRGPTTGGGGGGSTASGGGGSGGTGGSAPAGAGGAGGLTRASATGAPRYRLRTPLRIPPIKGRHSPTYAALARNHGLVRPAGYDASVRNTAQVPIWLSNVVPDLTQMPANHQPAAGGSWNLALERNGIVVRTLTAASNAELQSQLARPAWNAEGADTTFQVDHMIEYQLGGNDHQDNMELLDQQHNGSVGSSFAAEIRRAIRLELAAGPSRLPPPIAGKPPPSASMDIADVMADYDIEFAESTGRARNTRHTEGGASFWSAADIRTLQPVRELLPPRAAGLAGSASRLHVLSPSGNLVVMRLPVRNDAVQPPAAGSSNIAGFEIDAVTLTGGMAAMAGNAEQAGIGQLQGRLNLGAAVTLPAAARYSLPLDKVGGMEHTLKISATPGGPSGDAANATLQADFVPLSPMAITGIRAGSSIEAQATITPSHPALQGMPPIPAQIRNGRAGLFHTIDASALAQRFTMVPGLTLDSAAITLGYDGEAFSVQGGCDFTIRNFGTGYLNAGVDTAGRFSLEGGLRADTRLFDEASMRLWYRSEGGFGGEGRLAITNPDKIRGIRAAAVTARYQDGVFSATGSVEPHIPGLQSAGLGVRYGPDDSGAQSLLISGDLQLADGVPGLRGGTVHVDVLQREDVWHVAAAGELQPAIPGIDATLRARYADGAFTASVDTPFRIGERVSGTLLVGVSNLPSDSDGRPLEGATPGDSVLAFGHGTATVQLSDTFQGAFGIRVGTDATLAISGSVGISQPVTLFEQRRWNRELVHFPTVSIPIFGFAVGGNVVGIAATLGGGVNAEASVGPGQIDQGNIAITDFNPAQPDTLHVTGRVRFVVPAQAGLDGHVDAGISAGAAIIRATGGLSIHLGLGVDAGVQTPIDLDWTAAQGLVLSATLQASATPRLRASVRGFAEVVADAFVTSFTLWRREYTLAEREFGSSLAVGVTVPVAWRQQGGLDFDFNRVQFQVPDISPDGALAELLRDGGSDQQRNDAAR